MSKSCATNSTASTRYPASGREAYGHTPDPEVGRIHDLYKWVRVLLVFLVSLPLAAFAGERPLRFGLFPNLSPRVLLEAHQPLADYLSRVLHRPVYLETAPNFALFIRRTRERHYDLLLTAPHLAYLANAETGYQPLFAYDNPVQGMLVVPASAPYKSLQDLRGTKLAFADPLAVVTIMMEQELGDAGLLDGRDYQHINGGSHNNAALMVVQGKVNGAVIGVLPFQHMSDTIRRDLRPLAYTKQILSQVYLASPDLGSAQIEAIRTALGNLPATPEGRAFLAKGKLRGLIPIDTKLLAAYRPYGEKAAHRLDQRQ